MSCWTLVAHHLAQAAGESEECGQLAVLMGQEGGAAMG